MVRMRTGWDRMGEGSVVCPAELTSSGWLVDKPPTDRTKNGSDVRGGDGVTREQTPILKSTKGRDSHYGIQDRTP